MVEDCAGQHWEPLTGSRYANTRRIALHRGLSNSQRLESYYRDSNAVGNSERSAAWTSDA